MFRRRKKPEPELDNGSEETPLPSRLSPRSPHEALKPTAAPRPPERPVRERSGLLGTISGLLTMVVVAGIGTLVALSMLHRQADQAGPLTIDKVVVIPRSGTSDISEILQREGVIDHPSVFGFFARFSGKPPLKRGEYIFKAHASINDVIDTLTTGRQIQHAITFPEGLTSEQIIAKLNENDVLSGEVSETPTEGSLLPDTYKFERGATRQQIVNLMRNKQREVLNTVWQNRSREVPIKTPAELVTLASIVEKETGRADERPRVAGVFVNRLQKRMKLQSDPTIVYGLVGGRGTLGRGILRSEIERATPYNTYVIEGLPPGPIANPGRAALEAVANPSRTKDLYFVADGTGGHAFADSLEGHQRNVTRWRQVERSRQQTPQPETGGVDKVDPATSDPAAAPPERASAYAPTTDSAMVSENGADPSGKRSKAFDASEGTRLDPLRNKGFDLTTPKTVPVLKNPH